MFRKILVCCNGSKQGACAGMFALRLAQEEHADLELLSIVESLPSYMAPEDVIEEECRFETECLEKKQKEMAQMAAEAGVHLEAKIVRGKAQEIILRTAIEDGCDLIVLGRHNPHPLWVHQSGHTANSIIEAAPCPVLIAK